MKRVLHVLASNKFSGAENVSCTIIELFKDEYEMAYCSPKGPIGKYLKENNIKNFEIKKLTIKELKKVINEFKPDIIHAHDYRASLICSMTGFKGKIISHIHINAPFARTWNIKSLLYNLTIHKYYKIIGVSDSVIDEAIFKRKIKHKFIKIYNYVNDDLIIEKSKEYEFKKTYDIFYIGRLNECKNPIEFIEIISDLKKTNKGIKAVMIGDGELKQKCEKKIKEKKLSNNIDMLGFIENPYPIIINCKIGIMPSKVEGFGLTAIEASILGKPVLNSGVGGLKEVFLKKQELIYKTRNECISQIKKILNNKEKTIIDVERFCNKKEYKKQLKEIYK